MSYTFRDGDHLAKVEGQTVHCQRAHFFTTPSIPSRPIERIALGAQIGAGFALGGMGAVGIASLAIQLIRALFA
jgi:hypothetical protein